MIPGESAFPSNAVSYKVYVLLTTGTEAVSDAVTGTRPP
jgi:hypothetical protein